MASGKDLTTLARQNEDVGRVVFSPDGRLLLAAMRYGGGVKLWNTHDWTARAELQDKADFWFDAVFSPDGTTLAMAGGRRVANEDVGELKLWNPRTGESSKLFNRARSVYTSAFSADGRRLAAVDDDLSVVVWDLVAKKEITRIKRQTSSSADQVFFLSTGNDLLVTSIGLHQAEIWRIDH